MADIVDRLRKDSLADPKVVGEAEADRAVKDGKAGVAVVFPEGFGKAAPAAMLGAGDAPRIEMRYDPSKALEMQAVEGAIMHAAIRDVGVAAFGSSPAAGRPPFTIEPKAQTAAKAAGSDADYSQLAHSFAGMAMQGVLFYAINAAMAMLRDRRLGIWRRLLASPVTLLELLAAKALSGALIGAFVLAGVLAFGMLAFGIRVAGSLLGLGLVVVVAALMTSAFGLLAFAAAFGALAAFRFGTMPETA